MWSTHSICHEMYSSKPWVQHVICTLKRRPTCGTFFRWLAYLEVGPSSQWIDPANIFIHNKYIDACVYTHLPVPSSLTATCLCVYVSTNSIRTFVHLCTNLLPCLSICLSHLICIIYVYMQHMCTIWNTRAQIRSCLFSSCSPIDLTIILKQINGFPGVTISSHQYQLQ